MTKREIILNFISQFRELGAENCFSNGMCYYFTLILRKRFDPFYSTIMYDEIMNHFATRIDGRIYDITGDITDNPQYHWERWSTIKERDELHASRIQRDCIDKVPNDIHLCGFCPNITYNKYGDIICPYTYLKRDYNDTCNQEEKINA